MAAANPNSDNTDLESVFKRFDSNGDGKISASEMSGVVRALRADSTPDEIRLMMAEMDADRDGFVDLKEFVDFFLHDADASGDDNQLMDAFRMYDLDGNGRISAKELHQVLKRIGEKCSFGDCKRMIRSVDGDGDGAVDFKEFKKMMTKKNGGKK